MSDGTLLSSDVVSSGLPRPGRLLLGFLLVNGLLRLALLPHNAGEYTDGVLQLTQFGRQDSFWPPLYTAAAQALAWLPGVDALLGGQLVSWMASLLILFPLWRMARLWSGRRGAFFCLALYTVSPVILRWSVRVMTDAFFLLLFQLACERLLRFVSGKAETCGRHLAWAAFWAGLASLVRYQGVMLLPLTVLGVLWLFKRGDRGRLWSVVAHGVWLGLPAWWLFQRFGHVGQVVERQGAGWWSTFLNYWDVFEMFVYILPYALTLPVFGFVMVGLVGGPLDGERRLPVRWLLLYVALATLTAQSVFQSFQTRYLMPLLPMLFVCGGAGMARLEAYFQEVHRRRFRWVGDGLIAVTLVFSLGFGLTSFYLQRGAFGDIYAAGDYVQTLSDFDGQLYSNETYKPGMEGIKLSFASGREVLPVPDFEILAQLGRMSAGELRGRFGLSDLSAVSLERLWGSGRLDALGFPRLEPGAVVALHSAYGGLSQQSFLLRLLQARYPRLRPLEEGVLESRIVPLLPDIMAEPGTHQNPMAWALRYRPQRFRTVLLYLAP